MHLLLGLTMLVPGLLWPYALVALLRTMRAVPVLADVVLAERTTWPMLSVVSPACNEADGITAALESLASQDYPALEVIAVNDRSTDRTGELSNRWTGRRLCAGLFPNVALLLSAFLCVRAGVLGVRMGGIRWRGQLYETRVLAPAQRVRV